MQSERSCLPGHEEDSLLVMRMRMVAIETDVAGVVTSLPLSIIVL